MLLIIFCLILLLGAFLRLYSLNLVPPALDWDEAAVGWNAYSIWKTHLDEYGTRFPLTFMSFGDYKAPVLIYLTAPFVGLLGTFTWVVRLPSALAGIASVGVMFLLAWEVSAHLQLEEKYRYWFSYLSMFFT